MALSYRWGLQFRSPGWVEPQLEVMRAAVAGAASQNQKDDRRPRCDKGTGRGGEGTQPTAAVRDSDFVTHWRPLDGSRCPPFAPGYPPVPVARGPSRVLSEAAVPRSVCLLSAAGRDKYRSRECVARRPSRSPSFSSYPLRPSVALVSEYWEHSPIRPPSGKVGGLPSPL